MNITPIDGKKKTSPTLWTEENKKTGLSLITELSLRFSVMYPNSDQSVFSSAEKVNAWNIVWSEAFSKNNLVWEDIERGLDCCIASGSSFMPTLPEFVRYCKKRGFVPA